MKRAFVLSVGLLALSAAAGAEDLKAVYERALVNDPQIREADALRKATLEAKPQALSALLPQVSGSASKAKADTSAALGWKGMSTLDIALKNGHTAVVERRGVPHCPGSELAAWAVTAGAGESN